MIIAFYIIVSLLVGFSFLLSRRIKSGRDFLVPRDGLPFIMVAFTMAATQFGSSMLIGGVQQAQQNSIGQGFWPAVYTILAASASCFINLFISPRYRSYGSSVTPPDFIEYRYGRSRFLRSYHTIVYICSITCVLVSQFIGFAGIGAALGISYRNAIILCAVTVTLLTLGSGMVGVAFTDMLQFAFIIIMLVGSTVFSLKKLVSGGLTLQLLFSERFFPATGSRAQFWYTAWPMLIGNLFSYEYFMRFMTCRGEKEAKMASASAGVILLITVIPVALLGAVANYFYRDADSSVVFGLIIANEMPKVFGYLLIAGVLLAILTSADSMLTSLAGMASRDIYGGLLHPDISINDLVGLKTIAKISVLFFAVLAGVFAIFFRQILQITFFFSPLTSGTMFAPMIIGLFWKGANRKGAVASVICAATAAVLHLSGVITLFDRVAGPALIGSIAMIVFSSILRDRTIQNAGKQVSDD